MSYRVSVIVPVYNVENYLERCVSSLFAQTVQDMEFIFVDDCSVDNSLVVLRQCIAQHPDRKDQVKVIELEKNGGVDAARRIGCLESRGSHIMFVDSDDTVDANIVSRLLSAALKENADIVCCRRRMVYEDGHTEESRLYDKVEEKDKYLGYLISMITDKANPTITNKLFNREILKKVKFTPKGNISEDWVVCVQAVHKADKIVAVNECLYNYTVRNGSLTNTITKERCLESSIQDQANIDLIIDYLREEGLADKYRHEISARKYVAKGSMAPFAEDDDFYEKWKDIYREVNRSILFNPCLSLYDRKAYILRLFKLYSKYHKTMDSLRRILNKNKGQ